MAEKTQSGALNIYLAEYEKLKDEQIARIGFRDNLVYATLIAIGGILSFALTGTANFYAILILPLATFVLGWVYLNNDYKITTIGQYMRSTLTHHLREAAGAPEIRVLQWELIYKLEPRRFERKVLQVIVNEVLFVGSGFVALLAYFTTSTTIYTPLRWLASVELAAMLLLAVQIIIFADFRRKS